MTMAKSIVVLAVLALVLVTACSPAADESAQAPPEQAVDSGDETAVADIESSVLAEDDTVEIGEVFE